MKINSELKHSILFVITALIIGILAFSLEGSEINNITHIELDGNKYLTADKYLEFAQLGQEVEDENLTAALIRDRISKHPYIRNLDVIKEERGIVKIFVVEKKFEALLLNDSEKFLVCSNAEILPLIESTGSINLPVIMNNIKDLSAKAFTNACSYARLYQALRIIATAEIYDQALYNDISEINLYQSSISMQLMDFASPIYFGNDNEIEKTVYLSKIYNRVKQNKFSEYLDYIDLRYDELVYLGFDDSFINDKENI